MYSINHRHSGFTLIELMAVVAILSIVTVIALAAYGDYVVRSKVSEGMAFAAEAKTSVSAYYYDTNAMPTNNSQAGLPAAADYAKHKYIHKLEITTLPEPGTITITFEIPGDKADNKLLQLVPETVNGVVYWNCIPPAVDGIDVNQVPPNCRG
jgi:type IV pilus assembly protein PilA